MKKMQEAVYPVYWCHSNYYRGVLDTQELSREDFSLYYVELVLSDPPYNVRSRRGDVNSHCDVLPLESMVDVAAPRKPVIGRGLAATVQS